MRARFIDRTPDMVAPPAPVSRVLGPLCVRGHERGVYERRYAVAKKSAVRRCLRCQSEQAKERRQWEVENGRRWTMPVDVSDRHLAWAAFCADLDRRIATVRLHEGLGPDEPWETFGPRQFRIGRRAA